MKVLYYSHGLPLGGAETIVANQLIELKKRSVDVVLVVRQAGNDDTILRNRLEQNNIKILRLFKELPKNWFLMHLCLLYQLITYKQRWKIILKKESPDLIYIHTTTNLIYKIAFPVNRMIYTFHSEVERYIKLSRRSDYYHIKDMASKGMSFFVLSRKMEQEVKDFFHTEKVRIIPNFVNIQDILSSGYERNQFLEKEQIPEDAFILGHVGRFHEVKNHEKILDVFKELHSINKNSYLILIGGDCDGRMEIIKERVKAYGLSNYVRFLGIREDATSIVKCFNAFILPSFSESFSLALVEAQVFGIRCVASDKVPEDVICNTNCSTMSLEKSNKEWAKELLSNIEEQKNSSIDMYDVNRVMEELLAEFERIHRESFFLG